MKRQEASAPTRSRGAILWRREELTNEELDAGSEEEGKRSRNVSQDVQPSTFTRHYQNFGELFM